MEKELNAIFAVNLKKQLEEHQMSAAELSKKIGVSRSIVSEWLKGNKTPRVDKIDKICQLFRIRRSDLLSDQEQGIDYYLAGKELELILEYRAMNDTQKGRLLEYAELLRLKK